jgi:hypothetical protein
VTITEKDLHIPSEAVEPTFAYITARLWGACELVRAKGGSEEDLFSVCQNFWYGVIALDKVAISIRGLVHCGAVADLSMGLHLSLAASNGLSEAAAYIESILGRNPLIDEGLFPSIK